MTNSKTTKRALLTSTISLLLCFAMLLGTTFAWFTDTVTNGVNKIVSGNLDVELWHSTYTQSFADLGVGYGYSEDNGEEVKDDTKLFLNKDSEAILWEPGAEAVENFRIKNEGSLALKYMFKLEVAKATKNPEGKDLSDIIMLSMDEIGLDNQGNPTKTAIVSGKKLGDGYVIEGEILPEKYYDFSVGLEWVPSDRDNEFNVEGGLELELGITLLATQLAYEKDDVNGDEYDKDAEYPEVGYQVSTVEELNTAIEAGETNIYLASGTYRIPTSAQGKTLTISGSKAENTVIEVIPYGGGEGNGQIDYGLDGSTVTFNGVTIKTNNQTYAGYARLSGIYNNCIFENTYCLNGDSEFNNCTFNISGDQYNIWTWGAPNAVFENCTFNSDGKAILLYGTANTNLTVNNCTFNDTGVLTSLKAAIEIGNDYGKTYNLVVNNATVNGYEVNNNGINTGTTLWANKNSMSQDKLNVVVDGVDVY